MIIIVWYIGDKSQREYKAYAERILRQSSAYTDARLSMVQMRSFILASSEYTHDFIACAYPDSYLEAKLFKYMLEIYTITEKGQTRSALVFFDKERVILNDAVCDIASFLPQFYLTIEEFDGIRSFFMENPQENTCFIPVNAPGNQKYMIYVHCEQIQYGSPVYFFNLFTETQFFDLKKLDGGSLLFYYKDKLVYCAGAPVTQTKKEGRIKLQSVSSLYGYRYEYIAPQKKQSSVSIFLLFFFSAAFVLAAGFFMYLVNKKLSRSIKNLFELTRKSRNSPDEFSLLRKTVLHVHESSASLSASLDNYSKIIEDAFFKELMTGYIPPEKLETGLRLFRLDTMREKLCAVIITSDTENVRFPEISQNEMYVQEQTLMCELLNALSGFDFYRLVDMNYNTLVLVIAASDNVIIAELLKKILPPRQSDIDLNLIAAIGIPCANFADLADSFRSAIRLIEISRYLDLKERVLAFDDIKNMAGKSPAYYSLHTEQVLIGAVINGNTDTRALMLDRIFTDTLTENGRIARLALMLTATVQRIIDGLKNRKQFYFQAGTSPYQELAGSRTAGELRRKVEAVFDAITLQILNGQEKVNSRVVEEMLSFVHAEYVRDISLDDLAGAVKLSASYVSAVFKNAVGLNFKEYLNRYRYKQACLIIRNTPHLKIKEVAAAVGCNTEILARLFLRYSGMRPTDYQRSILADSFFTV